MSAADIRSSVARTKAVRIRLLGSLLLALCAVALHRIFILVHTLPHHEPAALELGLGLLAVLTGVAGAASFVLGPSLFRTYVWPPNED
jgi:hypothetical protein